ncbi:hypothetical protein [Cedecea sp. NFIX57]|uniref:hypothetical protein n=1 Tax=Cedecea sp. NFIX57 TaxID=1566286 RepID=UPI000A0DF00B|nr:hypothetical protein [Cedecea sp. NFIX57]SMG55492.1 hypothetical protein SAMN03159353_101857 [Cedecea sp. NFIX57]
MNNTILLLGFVSAINFFSLGASANDVDVSSAVKSYTFKDGEPYGLSQVYQIDAPDTGFPPYYIFQKLGKGNAYPFAFNREGLPGKDEPYSRCNVVLKVNDQYLIPNRNYKSGYAEDSEPCLGIDRMQIIKGNKDIKWYVTEALYQSEGDTPDKTEEIYFYSDNYFCFSKDFSSKLAAGKIKIKDLESLSVDGKNAEECAK